MAGNEKSGNVIAFRMSEAQLNDAIENFRQEYGDGSKGMVTWPRFCAFLGYSVEMVRECYLRGKDGKNAYNGRAEMLERFQTECKAMTYETSNKQQTLAKAEVDKDYLAPNIGSGGSGGQLTVIFGGTDPRAKEAMK